MIEVGKEPARVPEEAVPIRASPDFDLSMERHYMERLEHEDVAEMVMDSVVEVADGCETEPDGYCQHGYISPLLWLGMI